MLTETTGKAQNIDEQTPPHDNGGKDATFAELLKDFEPEPLKQGQFVQGEILQIDDNVILADVDAKRTAIVPPQDLEKVSETQLAQLNVGDEVTLYVLRTPVGDEDLLVSLNKGFQQQDWNDAREYMANEELLELKVVGHNKGGLLVAFGHLHGFVPSSHVPQLQRVYDQRQLASKKAKLVGEALSLKVIEVDRERRRLVLSAKKAQREVRQHRLQVLKAQEGETISGQITNLAKFGAFVDLDGIEGLIHISEIAWQKVQKPADFLTLGQEVAVLIKSVDVERERISLSRKALLPSPWQTFAETHAPGDLVEGVITNVADFGAFAHIADGVEGLIHASEMHGTKDFAPQDVLSPGDMVIVRILTIQPEKQRLALSQRRVSRNEEMEWTWQQQQPTSSFSSYEEE